MSKKSGFAISFDSSKDVSVRDDEYEFAKGMVGGDIKFITWVTKLKREKGKTEERLIVIGMYKLLSISRSRLGGLSVKREGHLFTLKKIISYSISSLTFIFDEFTVEFQSDKVDEILKTAVDILSTINYHFPLDSRVVFDIMPPDRLPTSEITLPLGGFVELYRAACSFFTIQPAESVISVARSCAASKEFNLSYILQGSDPSATMAVATASVSNDNNNSSINNNNNNATSSSNSSSNNTNNNNSSSNNNNNNNNSNGSGDAGAGMENLSLTSTVTTTSAMSNAKFNSTVQINATTELHAVMYALRFNTYFTSIRINGVVPKDKKASIIAEVAVCVEKNRFIQTLTLSALCCNHGYDVLSKSLADNPFSALSEIDLSGNQIKDAGMVFLADGLATLSLKCLDLSRCGMDSKGISALANALTTSKSLGNSLVALNLSFNRIGKSGSTALEKWLSSRQPGESSLITLLLSNCSVEISALCSGLSKMGTALVILDVSYSKINSDAAKSLSVVLAETISIQDLDLSGCDIKTDSLALVTKAFCLNKKVNHSLVNVSSIDIGNNFPVVIQSFSGTNTLHTLALDDTGITSRGVVALMDLISSISSLKRLQISRILSEKEKEVKSKDKTAPVINTSVAIQKIVQYLSSNSCSLQAFQISGDKQFQLGKMIVPIINALSSNKSLVEFDFSGQGGGDISMETLSSSLTKNSTLRVLLFDDNHIGILGLEKFMNGLKENKSICDIPYLTVDLSRIKSFISSCKKDKAWEHRKQLSYILQTISSILKTNKVLAYQLKQQQLNNNNNNNNNNDNNNDFLPPPPPALLEVDEDGEAIMPPESWATGVESSQEPDYKRMTMEAARMTMNVNKLALEAIHNVYGAVPSDASIAQKVQTVQKARATIDMTAYNKQQEQS